MDDSDNDNNHNNDQNDHSVVERGINNSNMLDAIFNLSDSDDDDYVNEPETAAKLLDNKYVMEYPIMNGEGDSILVKCIFLVLRDGDAIEEDGVLISFLDRESMRKLCISVSKCDDETNMIKNTFARNVTQFALSPILKVPVTNKKKAPSNLVMISVRDVINFISKNLLKSYVKKIESEKSMMNGLENLSNPSILPNCSEPFHHGNNHSDTLVVDGRMIRKPDFPIRELL
jgi:hypothetical protein